MISCNGVKIQESENIVPFNFVNESLPASNQRIDNFHVNNFVLNDLDEISTANSEQIKPMCNDVSIGLNVNGLARKSFIIQIISNSILPTHRALRSDVLLI